MSLPATSNRVVSEDGDERVSVVWPPPSFQANH
jgi:hypothetical protein